jgi:hypothetical protein
MVSPYVFTSIIIIEISNMQGSLAPCLALFKHDNDYCGKYFYGVAMADQPDSGARQQGALRGKLLQASGAAG